METLIVRLGQRIVKGQRSELTEAGMEAVILYAKNIETSLGKIKNFFFLLQIHELQYGPDVLLPTYLITCF
jgi:hypothetical protein